MACSLDINGKVKEFLSNLVKKVKVGESVEDVQTLLTTFI
jgi:hypothetical protein